MNEIINDLIKDYYSGTIIRKRAEITEEKGKRIVHIFHDHIANMLGIEKSDKSTDFEEGEKLNTKNNTKIARQVYRLANMELNRQGKMLSYKRKYELPMPKIEDDIDIVMEWSVGALLECGVITFQKFDIGEPQIDEDKKLMGIKKIPKEEYDEYSEFAEE